MPKCVMYFENKNKSKICSYPFRVNFIEAMGYNALRGKLNL